MNRGADKGNCRERPRHGLYALKIGGSWSNVLIQLPGPGLLGYGLAGLHNTRRGITLNTMRVNRAQDVLMSSPSNNNPVASPKWAQNLRRLNNWLLFDLGGGPRPMKLVTVINIQKYVTLQLQRSWWLGPFIF
ncbi:hypothetical protein SAMN05216296_3319 [Pseudomonas pohangensis]|uniref:Uncharacterized protein n=2 Tax=Pseudomonas pohangensis TaxID=364197 RepID=A0A1H2HWI8_9PSED|nr:hypothetical protein SAMN05216296_3319 [Pseudomonas pohangensis]